MKKKIISLLLVAVMLMGILPLQAMAAGAGGTNVVAAVEFDVAAGVPTVKVKTGSLHNNNEMYYGIVTKAVYDAEGYADDLTGLCTANFLTTIAGVSGVTTGDYAFGSKVVAKDNADFATLDNSASTLAQKANEYYLLVWSADAGVSDPSDATDLTSRVYYEPFKTDSNGDLAAPLAAGTATAQSWTVGTAVDYQIPYTGGYGTISASGTLPDGLNFNGTKIVGTPTVANTTSSDLTITLTDAGAAVGSNTVTVTIAHTIAKGTATLTGSNVTFTYGETKSVSVNKGSHDGALTYAVTSGNDLVSVNASTGELTFIKGDGKAVVTATAAGTTNWNEATKDVEVTVKRAAGTAPTLKTTDATAAGANDGKLEITNYSAANTYKYKEANDVDWKNVTAATTTGLAPGSYTVRVEATDTHNEAVSAAVTISEPGAPKATITDLAKTYTGKPQGATVAVTIDGAPVAAADYTVSYTGTDGTTYAKSETAPTDAGKYTVTVEMKSPARPAGTATLVIAQAKPGEPELLDEIIVDETTLGDVMKNGALKLPGVNNDEVAGTFTWVGDVDDDTMIVPGTKYQWKFETTNPNYQGLVGEIAWELVNDEHAAYMFGTNAAKTTFEPTRGMTRAEVAVMIANLEEYDKDEDYAAELTKVPQDLKAEKANLEKWTDNGYNKICYILSEGIMQGRSDGNFDPYGTITRQEMAIVLGKYLGIAKYDGANLFNDLDKTAVYAEGKAYINALKDAKKIDGFPDGGYHPTENLTRAQAAKMMNYAMDRVPDIAKMKAANVESSFVDVQKFAGIADADWAVYNIIEASVTHAVSEYH